MRQRVRIAAACGGLLLLLAAGCARARSAGAGAVAGSSRVGWATKAVIAKREPESLLARDGTVCRVAPDRFRDTAVGDQVECNWQ